MFCQTFLYFLSSYQYNLHHNLSRNLPAYENFKKFDVLYHFNFMILFYYNEKITQIPIFTYQFFPYFLRKYYQTLDCFSLRLLSNNNKKKFISIIIYSQFTTIILLLQPDNINSYLC